jgi:hypothetical protein
MAEREALIRADGLCSVCKKKHSADATGQADLKACARDWANFNPPKRNNAKAKVSTPNKKTAKKLPGCE